jgi:hypothetical protein
MLNRRIGTMPNFAAPPKGAICAETVCNNPATRMLMSVKPHKGQYPMSSPACTTCAEAAITARRARLTATGEHYHLATESTFVPAPEAPETVEIQRETAPPTPSTGRGAGKGTKVR